MDFRKNTDTLNKIPIQEIAAWLGIILPKKGSTRCPFPDHEDQNPSFEIKASGTRWVCYGCNRNGGSIDFIKEYNQIDFLAAKQWLEEKTRNGVSAVPTNRKPVKKRNNDEPAASSSAPDSGEHTDIYEFLLTLCPLLESGSNYLLSRGITSKTISTFRVAQVPSGQGTLTKLINKFGFERVNAAGLLTKKSTTDSARIIFPWNAVVFPFLENSKVIPEREIRPDTRAAFAAGQIATLAPLLYHLELVTLQLL